MFQKTTKKIVEEMDPKGLGLIPLESPYLSDHCKPLHLLKLQKSFFPWRNKYFPMSITLTDILKDGQGLDFGLTSSSLPSYSEDSSTSVSGNAEVKVSNIEPGIQVSGNISNSLSVMEMRKQIIDINKLLDVISSRKVNREHSFMKQLMADVVYVVSEVIETEKACSVDWISQAKSKLGIWFNIVNLQGGFGINSEKKITFSAGTTIAYKVSELRVSPDDTMELNWKSENTISLYSGQKGSNASLVDQLTMLSADQRLLLLNMVLDILRSSENLPFLDAMLEQMDDGLQPDLQVLDLMEERSRASVEKVLDLLGIKKADPPGEPLTLSQDQSSIIQAVNFLIQSLSEIDPETLILLAYCVEANIISKQRDLVKIIDENWCMEVRSDYLLVKGAEDLEKTLIAQLTDREMELTQQILDEYGFQMNRESSSVSPIDGRRRQSIVPLFAALSALCILSA